MFLPKPGLAAGPCSTRCCSSGPTNQLQVNGRAASTAILYLLPAGAKSKLHRLDASECWHTYLGAAGWSGASFSQLCRGTQGVQQCWPGELQVLASQVCEPARLDALTSASVPPQPILQAGPSPSSRWTPRHKGRVPHSSAATSQQGSGCSMWCRPTPGLAPRRRKGPTGRWWAAPWRQVKQGVEGQVM